MINKDLRKMLYYVFEQVFAIFLEFGVKSESCPELRIFSVARIVGIV